MLLFVQILGFLLYPLMEDTSAGRALFGVISLLVLGAALYVVKRGPWLTGFAVVLALPVVVLSIWLAFDFDPRRMLIMAALEAMFYFYAAGSLIAYMLEDEFATIDELFAAGATGALRRRQKIRPRFHRAGTRPSNNQKEPKPVDEDRGRAVRARYVAFKHVNVECQLGALGLHEDPRGTTTASGIRRSILAEDRNSGIRWIDGEALAVFIVGRPFFQQVRRERNECRTQAHPN